MMVMVLYSLLTGPLLPPGKTWQPMEAMAMRYGHFDESKHKQHNR